MARTWADLLGEGNGAPEPEEERTGFFSRLRDSLSKSRQALTAEISLAAFDAADEEAWERLEGALVKADARGPAPAQPVPRAGGRCSGAASACLPRPSSGSGWRRAAQTATSGRRSPKSSSACSATRGRSP